MTEITFFTTSLSGGGAQKVFTTLATEISTRGYDVDFIVIDRESEEPDLDEVNIVELEANRIRYTISELVKYLDDESPQVIYSTLSGPNIVTMIAGKLTSTDTQIIAREATTRSVSAKQSTGLKKSIENQSLKYLYPTADTVVALSEYAKSDLIEFTQGTGSNITKIPNPIDIKRVQSLAKKPVSHEWFTEDTTVIIGVGRLVPKNDFETLIQAFDEVNCSTKEKLIILGSGRKREDLQMFIEENHIRNVDLFGYVDNPYKYLAKADVFALTSRYEGMPNTVIEALTCGTPVVATDSPGGTSEVLAHGQYGKLAEIGDVSRISQLLAETLNSEINRKELKRYAKNYSIGKIADAYLDLATPI